MFSFDPEMPRLTEAAGDDADLRALLIGKFVDDLTRVKGEVATLLEAGDGPGLKRAFHTLKGNSYLFGSESMGALCSELEEFATAGDLEKIRDRQDQFQEQSSNFLEALS